MPAREVSKSRSPSGQAVRLQEGGGPAPTVKNTREQVSHHWAYYEQASLLAHKYRLKLPQSLQRVQNSNSILPFFSKYEVNTSPRLRCCWIRGGVNL